MLEHIRLLHPAFGGVHNDDYFYFFLHPCINKKTNKHHCACPGCAKVAGRGGANLR